MHLALLRVALDDSESLITVGGLPLHPLAVHAVVVLLPLSALALIAIIMVPKWRAPYAKLVLAGLAIGAAASFVAVQAGEQLAEITGISEEHEQLGTVLGWVSGALLVAAAVWLWSIRTDLRAAQPPTRRFGSSQQALLALVSMALAVASLGLVAVVGHSGASAVWENRIAPKSADKSDASASASASASSADYTMAQVAKHNTPSDCWTVVNGQVYDVTNWITRHPGGPGVIKAMCGIDGSAAFLQQHGNQQEPSNILESFRLGALA